MMKHLKYLMPIIICIGLLSCKDQLSTFEKYVNMQNKYVVGAPISMTAKTGDRKAELEFVISADPRITKALISWKDEGEDVERVIDINREVPAVDTFNISIDAIGEGVKTFELTLFDEVEDASEALRTVAFIYGPNYESLLVPRRISEIITAETDDPEVNTANVTWAAASNEVLETTMSWTNTAGETTTIMIDNSTKTTELVGYGADSKITVVSKFLPEPDALDEFTSMPLDYSYPGIVADLDKSLWQYVGLPHDLPESDPTSGWGPWSNTWDGDIGTGYAWLGANNPRPAVVTIDIGLEKVLKEWNIQSPGWAAPWGPKDYEIWAIHDVDDINDVATSMNVTAENLGDWKDEMVAKGWTNLAISSPAPEDAGNVTSVFNNDLAFRYVRILIKGTWHANPDCIIYEMNARGIK
jgi:hypothetical protein